MPIIPKNVFRKQVRGAMEIAVFIQNIQEERAEVALYIFLNNSNANFDMSEVLSNNNRYQIISELEMNQD